MGSQNQRNLAPPGKMVDIGGFRLHAVVCGQGTPTVLFEPAMGGFALQYGKIQAAVASFTQTIAYDRAGQGWSDPSPNPRTPDQMAGELKTLLGKLGLQPPYVLVGHSFGGMLTRIYAGRYPGEVAGMVLVDVTHVDEYAPFPNIDKMISQMAVGVRLLKLVSRVGLGKPLTKLSMGPNAKAFSKEDLDTYLAIASQPKHHDTMLAEFSQHRHFFGAQSEVPSTLGDLPLMVVTAGKSVSGSQKIGGVLTGDEMNVLHQKLQKDLAQLSTQGEQVIIPEATHFSIFTHPDHAAQVTNAIRRVVERVRRQNS